MRLNDLVKTMEEESGALFADDDLFGFVLELYRNDVDRTVQELQRIGYEIMYAFDPEYPAILPSGGDPAMRELLKQHCEVYRAAFPKKPTLSEYFQKVREEMALQNGG